jgi:hypothetical protein
MREYKQSDEISIIAGKMIQSNHQHLKNAAIAYLIHKVDNDKKDPLALPEKRQGQSHKIASAKLVPENYKALTGFDFLLTVDERFWLLFDEEKKIALVDHELKHMRQDIDGFYCANHDIEEFSDVVVRHGMWKADVRRFFDAVQMALPFHVSPEDVADVKERTSVQ